MQILELNRSLSSNRLGGIFLKIFSAILVVIAIAPFAENWYENKVDERLNQNLEANVERATRARERAQRFADKEPGRTLTKEERDQETMAWDVAVLIAQTSEKMANEIAQRAIKRLQTTPWWSYIPVATTPVSLYSSFNDLFSTSFSFGSMLLIAIVNASLVVSVAGYWARRRWGASSMALFCFLAAGLAIYEAMGTTEPDFTALAIRLSVLVICLTPAIFLPWYSNGTRSPAQVAP